MGEFDTDFADAHGLWVLYNRIRQLEEGVADTQMTAGSEAFQAALLNTKNRQHMFAKCKV